MTALVDPDQARALAQEILQAPEFHAPPQAGPFNLIYDLLHGLAELKEGNPWVYQVLVAGLVMILLVMAGHLALSLWRAGKQLETGRSRPKDPQHAGAVHKTDAGFLERAARDLAERGSFGPAVAALYLAVAARLGVFDGKATNQELASALTGMAPPDAVTELAGLADRGLYSSAALDESEWEHAMRLSRVLTGGLE